MKRLSGRTIVAALCAFALGAAGARAAERPLLEGIGDCSGLTGRYLAAVGGGAAVVVSGAEFPGGVPGGGGDLVAGSGARWKMSVSRLPAATGGCVAFDKDRFTWPGDLATYVQYLVRDLLAVAQALDPAVRAVKLGEGTVRLEASRPGADTAVLAGPEGAMLGYGRRSDPERYFFLPVRVGSGDRLLVRVFRNQGEAFGERATEVIGAALVGKGERTLTQTTPAFELRWLDPPQ